LACLDYLMIGPEWLTNAGVGSVIRGTTAPWHASWLAPLGTWTDCSKITGGGRKRRKVFWKRKWVQVPVKPKLTNLNEVNTIDIGLNSTLFTTKEA
jgi:hypothetical protein